VSRYLTSDKNIKQGKSTPCNNTQAFLSSALTDMLSQVSFIFAARTELANMSLPARSEQNLSPTKTPHNPRSTDILRTLPILRSVTPANIGRRRKYSSSLLSTPARHSHQHQMSAIFHKAATSLSARKLDFGPRSVIEEDETSSTIDTTVANDVENLEVVKYPVLPRILDYSSPPNKSKRLTPARTPRISIRSPENRKDTGGLHSTETIKTQPFLHKLGRPGATKFERENSNVLLDYPGCSSSSTSSDSWTGDSQFFTKKTRGGPTHERQCSVSKWLDLLPGISDEHFEADDEDVWPLSPSVEVERGSMRRRRRETEARGRHVSLNDDNIFSALLR
jgi:hypothetical protein